MWSKKRFNANNIIAVAALSSSLMLSSCQVLVRQIEANLQDGQGYVYNDSVKKSTGIAGIIRLGGFDAKTSHTEWSDDLSFIRDLKRKNGISLYSVQLNAALVAKTDTGKPANFLLQNLVSIDSKSGKVYIMPGSEFFQYNSSQTDPVEIDYTVKGNGKIVPMPNYDGSSYVYNDFNDASGPYTSLVMRLGMTEKIDKGKLQINFYFDGKRFDRAIIGNDGSFLSAKLDAAKHIPIEFGIVGFRNGEGAVFTKQYQRTELEIKQLSGNKWTPLDISANGKNVSAETSNLRYMIRNGHTAEAMLQPQK